MSPLTTQSKPSVFLAFKLPDMAAEKRTRGKSFKCSQHLKVHSDGGPTSVLSVKIVSDNHPTYKTIYGYTVEKNPTNVLSVTSVSDGQQI